MAEYVIRFLIEYSIRRFLDYAIMKIRDRFNSSLLKALSLICLSVVIYFSPLTVLWFTHESNLSPIAMMIVFWPFSSFGTMVLGALGAYYLGSYILDKRKAV